MSSSMFCTEILLLLFCVVTNYFNLLSSFFSSAISFLNSVISHSWL